MDVDDHATPALVVLPDCRIIVAVSKHIGKVIRIAIFSKPYDISSWTIVDLNTSKTLKEMLIYPSPPVLGGRSYVFFRDGSASNSCWRFIYSDDMGITWTNPQSLLDPLEKAPGVLCRS